MKKYINMALAIILLPPMAVWVMALSIAILVVDGFNPFYLQKRIGKNGRLFVCYKLQTLRPTKSQDLIGVRERDKERSTRLGDFIRDHGWDETPQLLNVLLGNMNFIGPRPLLSKTIERIQEKNPEIRNSIDEWKKHRWQVLPGITGLHQTTFATISIINCDVRMETSSFLEKLKILLITMSVFIFGKRLTSKWI